MIRAEAVELNKAHVDLGDILRRLAIQDDHELDQGECSFAARGLYDVSGSPRQHANCQRYYEQLTLRCHPAISTTASPVL